MKKSIWIAFALGLTACVGMEETPDQDWTPDEKVVPDQTNSVTPTVPVEKPATAAPLETCVIEPLWWTSEAEHRATPQHFEFTADGTAIISGADVFGSGHRAWRASDGEVIFERGVNHILGANADDSRILRNQFVDGEQRLSVSPLGAPDRPIWSRNIRLAGAAIDGTGSRVAFISQHFDEERQHTWFVLEVVDIDTNTRLFERTFNDGEFAWWAPYGHSVLEFSDDGKKVAVGLMRQWWTIEDFVAPRVHLLSETEHGWNESTIDVPFERDQPNGYDGQIASISFSPQSDRLEIVSSTGQMVAVDTTDAAIVDTGVRGAFAANWDTYLPPLPASPVVWTSNGRVKFTVAEDGALNVALGETTLGQFVANEPSDAERFGWNPEVSNPVMGVSVAPDSDKFAVAFRRGIGVWGCANSLPTGEGGLNGATLRATRSPDSPYAFDLDITLDGQPASELWGYEVFINGESRGSFSGDTKRHSHSFSEGSVVIQVEVRDVFGAVRSNEVRL